MEGSWFNSPQGKDEMGKGGPHRWNSSPSLERLGCEAGHSPLSRTEICSSTCLQSEQRDNLTFTSRKIRLYLYVPQSVQSRSHKIKRKFFLNCHSVTVDISQRNSLLSNASLRSVTLGEHCGIGLPGGGRGEEVTHAIPIGRDHFVEGLMYI
jgi:hypothetical protein